jgi:hypothetical protein
MAKEKKESSQNVNEKQAYKSSDSNQTTNSYSGLLKQGFISLACWMTFGFLLEGLIGYKIPTYLNDNLRRELFQLAHTHGTLFSVVLIVVAICLKLNLLKPNNQYQIALRVGSVVMPVGFLLGGIWHYESDPGFLIWLSPIGAVIIIFGIVSAFFSINKN